MSAILAQNRYPLLLIARYDARLHPSSIDQQEQDKCVLE
jgi:hypothetical protein